MKKALLVGISDYPPAGPGPHDMQGAINDVGDMANTLIMCGFPVANLRILTNGNATRANIIVYLLWLIRNSQPGSSLVFYFSGSGTKASNIGPDLEIDGLDEAIVPYDYATRGLIRDDDLKEIFNLRPAGVNLEVILDSCFSGTGTRDLAISIDNEGRIKTSGRPRFIHPMLEDEFYFLHQKELTLNGDVKKIVPKAIIPVPGLNHILWAACRDNQVVFDQNIGGMMRGCFTYAMCRILRTTYGLITRRALDARIASMLRDLGGFQINQTEADPVAFDQPVFYSRLPIKAARPIKQPTKNS